MVKTVQRACVSCGVTKVSFINLKHKKNDSFKRPGQRLNVLIVVLQVIYVSRNPKDVLVSFYHFHNMANFLPEAGSFPQFLDQFLEDKRELTQVFFVFLCFLAVT